MRLFKRILLGAFGLILLFLIGAFLLIQITPKPVAYLTRTAFDGGEQGVSYGLHPDYQTMLSQIVSQKDQRYPSKYANATYDIYMPKDTSNKYPVMLWVHGGAFVGGDKKDMTSFAIALAAKGNIVITMNYALALEAIYPTPILQVNDMVKELSQLKTQLPMTDDLFIGGDSAGAHIAFQWAVTQTNDTYRQYFAMEQTIDPDHLKGAISFCGLLDFSMFDETDSAFSNFLYRQCAWAYLDHKDWKTSLTLQHVDFLSAIDDLFPPVYLSDGNRNSFLDQAKKAKTLLENKSIPVTALFWETGKHLHEYQFHLNEEAGLKNFNMVLQFIQENKG